VGRLAAGPYAAETDPLLRARGFLEHAARIAPGLWKEGCLRANLAADAAGSSRVISRALQLRTRELHARLADVLAPLATAEATATDLADRFLVCVEGSIVLARIHRDPGYLQRGLEDFRRRLDQAAG
jgi:hypothetical protein